MPGPAFGAGSGKGRLRRGLAATLALVLATRVLAARGLVARVFGGFLLDGRLLRRARDFDAMVSVIPAPVNNMASRRAGVTAAFTARPRKAP
jgi:hypothetical protein